MEALRTFEVRFDKLVRSGTRRYQSRRLAILLMRRVRRFHWLYFTKPAQSAILIATHCNMQLWTSTLVGQIPAQYRAAPVQDELTNRPLFFLDPPELF